MKLKNKVLGTIACIILSFFAISIYYFMTEMFGVGILFLAFVISMVMMFVGVRYEFRKEEAGK